MLNQTLADLLNNDTSESLKAPDFLTQLVVAYTVLDNRLTSVTPSDLYGMLVPSMLALKAELPFGWPDPIKGKDKLTPRCKAQAKDAIRTLNMTWRGPGIGWMAAQTPAKTHERAEVMLRAHGTPLEALEAVRGLWGRAGGGKALHDTDVELPEAWQVWRRELHAAHVASLTKSSRVENRQKAHTRALLAALALDENATPTSSMNLGLSTKEICHVLGLEGRGMATHIKKVATAAGMVRHNDVWRTTHTTYEAIVHLAKSLWSPTPADTDTDTDTDTGLDL